MNDFDDLTDLDEVLGALRSAATPAELSQEGAVVERMVKVRCTTEGKHMFTSRRARVATLVAAGVLGFGGMAAASPSLLGDQPAPEPIVQPEPVVQPEEVVEDETTEPTDDLEPVGPIELEPADEADHALDEVEDVELIAPAVAAQEQERFDVPLVDDPATDFIETTCLPGNHGATVSAVARGEFPDGVSVRDAARSSCGKIPKVDVDDVDDVDDLDADVDVDDAEPEAETEAEPEVEAAEERPGRDKGAASNGNPSENSNGKSNGRGNGNGNGNGNGAPGKRGG